MAILGGVEHKLPPLWVILFDQACTQILCQLCLSPAQLQAKGQRERAKTKTRANWPQITVSNPCGPLLEPWFVNTITLKYISHSREPNITVVSWPVFVVVEDSHIEGSQQEE